MKRIATPALLVMAALVSACDQSASNNSTSSSSSPPPVGVVDNSKGFQVWDLDTAYLFHNDGMTSIASHTYAASLSWGNPGTCIAASGQDVMCYAEAPELDLWFGGVNLQYNVPTSMCSYVSVSMPWYWIAPAGDGGDLVAYTVTAGTGTSTTTDTTNSQQGQPYCPFDYSNPINYPTNPGPNCCEGKYQQNVTNITTGPSGTTSTTASSSATWTGKRSNCIDGPAVRLETLNKNGFPRPVIYQTTGVGLSAKITVPSPNSLYLPGNVFAANYFDLTSSKNYDAYDATYNPTGIKHGDYPPALDPGSNTALTAPPGGGYTIPGSSPSIKTSTAVVDTTMPQPFYQFECYNNYQEVVARIRVLVRAWDSVNQIGNASSYGPNYSPELGVGGFEPMHDHTVLGDLFFNYIDDAGTALRTPWASTTDASCTGGAYIQGASYSSSTVPCVQQSSMSYTSGFPGWATF